MKNGLEPWIGYTKQDNEKTDRKDVRNSFSFHAFAYKIRDILIGGINLLGWFSRNVWTSRLPGFSLAICLGSCTGLHQLISTQITHKLAKVSLGKTLSQCLLAADVQIYSVIRICAWFSPLMNLENKLRCGMLSHSVLIVHYLLWLFRVFIRLLGTVFIFLSCLVPTTGTIVTVL